MAKATRKRPTASGVEEEKSVEESLIEKLGLYEEFPISHDEVSDGKGDVESE
jgi:hypothetical protein